MANCERHFIANLSIDQQVRHYQENASANQVVSRGLNRYIQNFSTIYRPLAKGRHQKDFHWVDVGGGAGIAALESFFSADGLSAQTFYEGYKTEAPTPLITSQHRATVISVENLFDSVIVDRNLPLKSPKSTVEKETFTLNSLLTVANRQKAAGNFKYLSGRYFEDIPAEEIGQANLITDYFGAFSYSAHKFEILKKFAQMLAPGGVAFIHSKYPKIEVFGPNGEETAMSLEKFLETSPVEGLTIGEYTDEIILRPGPNTVADLDRLIKTLEFHRTDDRYLPPTFYYRKKRLH